MALHIGITGNIGAGKSTVCREFARLGIPIYYADAEAKSLMVTDEELRSGITDAFGARSYTPKGELDRAYLASVVFGDEEALRRLNALVHPAVARHAADWHRQQSTPYTLHEAAILYEIGAEKQYDAIIVVSCPEPLRRARVMVRDGMGEQAFRQRAARQWSDERKEAAADYLIRNDGRSLLLPQILRTDRLLRDRGEQNPLTRT